MATRDSQALDKALMQQREGTYTDPVVEAKQLLARLSAARPEESATGTIGPLSGRQKLRYNVNQALEPLANLKPAVDIAEKAALPASLMGGIPAAAAGGYYALQGLYNSTDPNAGAADVGMALAPLALPAAGRLRGAGAAAEEGAVLAGKPWRGVNMGGKKATSGFLTNVSHNDMPLAGNLDETLSASRFRNQTPQVVNEAIDSQVMPGADDVESSLAGLKNAMGIVPNSRKVQRAGRLNRMTDEVRSEYNAAKKEGTAGFSGTPEMSLGELARITENMRRITGR